MAVKRNVRVLSPSNSELSDSDRELESQPDPSKKSAKKRKMKYKNKFQRSGQRPGNSSLRYLEISSCQYQGVRDVKDHISSQIHQTLAKEAQKLSFHFHPLIHLHRR